MARYIFTGGNGIAGETGLVVRNGLNANFIELYAWLHQRSHLLTSATDHGPATGTSKNKFLKSDAATGYPVWMAIADDDIPGTIARDSDLANHINDTANPHDVGLTQLADVGDGIIFGEPNPTNREISISLPSGDGGLGFDTNSALRLDYSNIVDSQQAPLSGSDLIALWTAQGGDHPFSTTVDEFKAWVLGTAGNPFITEIIENTSGKQVAAVATRTGVTAVWSGGNTLTVNIPDGTELSSLEINLNGYPTMQLILVHAPVRPIRFYPIMQAWRDDTKAQLVGAVVTGNALANVFTISGLINTTTNNIRVMV